MANLKIIRKRIGSVKNTQQITKAMKMVSAARLRRAQESAVASRPYAQKLDELLSNVAGRLSNDAHPLLRQSEAVEKVGVIVVTSDRGLCGAFNSSIIRMAQRHLDSLGEAEVSLFFVGRKAQEYFRLRGHQSVKDWLRLPGPSIETAREIADAVTPGFAAGAFDRIDLVFAEFRSALTQVPKVAQLLPVSIESSEEAGGDYVIEPEPRALLARLLPRYVEARIYSALLESAAGEHGARMTAMDSATRNASKMIGKLTLQMNRARQAAITTELMEIVGGAEALDG